MPSEWVRRWWAARRRASVLRRSERGVVPARPTLRQPYSPQVGSAPSGPRCGRLNSIGSSLAWHGGDFTAPPRQPLAQTEGRAPDGEVRITRTFSAGDWRGAASLPSRRHPELYPARHLGLYPGSGHGRRTGGEAPIFDSAASTGVIFDDMVQHRVNRGSCGTGADGCRRLITADAGGATRGPAGRRSGEALGRPFIAYRYFV